MNDFTETRKLEAEPVINWFKLCSDGAGTVRDEFGHYIQEQTRRNIDAWVTITSQLHDPLRVVETQSRWMQETMAETQHLLATVQGVIERQKSA